MIFFINYNYLTGTNMLDEKGDDFRFFFTYHQTFSHRTFQ